MKLLPLLFLGALPAMATPLPPIPHLPPPFTEKEAADELLLIEAHEISDADVLAQWDLLASLFTNWRHWARSTRFFDTDSMGMALTLLHRADAARAQEMIQNLPLWQEVKVWQGRYPRIVIPLQGLEASAPSVSFPARWLHERALFAVEHSAACELPDVRRRFIRLMTRDRSPETTALLEQLRAEGSPPPLCAEAWAILLEAEDLPTLIRDEIDSWFRYRLEPEEITPELRLAIFADQCEHVFSPPCYASSPYIGEKVPALRPEDAPEVLRTIGAPKAAELYPRAKEATRAERMDALIEMEIAYARYIWKHREELRRLREAVRGRF